MSKTIGMSISFVGFVFAVVFLASMVFAGHNGAVVEIEPAACEETTFTASIMDTEGTHQVDNMQLIVDADGDTQASGPIPTNGDEVSLTVGPFDEDTTVMWRVFGGGERDYDNPSWDGYGDPGFADDVADYGDANGFDWVILGPDDPNPFTTWHEEEIQGCYPVDKDECKNGGWQDFGYRNQGQCIRHVNTGQDSR